MKTSGCAACDRGERYVRGREYIHTGYGPRCGRLLAEHELDTKDLPRLWRVSLREPKAWRVTHAMAAR